MKFVIEIAAYVCECITLLLCIHSFLGKKIRLDYKTVLFVFTLVTILMIILNLNLSDIYTMINQVIIFVYIYFEFRLSWQQNLILMILILLSNVAVQAITIIPAYLLLTQLNFVGDSVIMGFLINFISPFIMFYFIRLLRLNKLYAKIIKFDKEIIKVLIFCASLLLVFMIEYKINNRVQTWAYFASGVFASVIIIVLFYLQKERYENKKKNLELHMHKLYGKAFEGMVENIRIRQHDFKNQLAAIYGMHLIANSFEDLVERQREYCNHLISKSRYDSILTKCNDKILAGFLYTKLSEAEKAGVEVEFEIIVKQLNYSLEIYEIIEVIGILIDNAVENESQKTKRIYFQLIEQGNKLCILCRNVTEYIPIDMIHKYFKKGFSTKGKNRGLGLYNLKALIEGKGEIIVRNHKIDNDNWLEFKIEIDAKD